MAQCPKNKKYSERIFKKKGIENSMVKGIKKFKKFKLTLTK